MKTFLTPLAKAIESPTPFDSLSNYMGKIPSKEWYFVLSKNRDSDVLTRSNFESALKILGGESETVQIDRYGHWACGWYETISVSGEEKIRLAEDIQKGLEQYPVVDECHLSETEQEEANETWQNCYSDSERLEYIREHRNQFEFRSYSEIREVIRFLMY